VTLRDDIEQAIRSWSAYETLSGAPATVDFDCFPVAEPVEPADSRLAVYRRLAELRQHAEHSGKTRLIRRLDADIAYLGALLGERHPLSNYVLRTQGCPAAGWPADYVTWRGDAARAGLEALGLRWGPKTGNDLTELEGPISVMEVPEAIRHAASQYETAVRQVTGTDAPYELTIETTDVDAYWTYWLDGAGQQVRLRLNLRDARFSAVGARQFALHEILGHGLQGASFAARCAREDVPWVRLLSVHASQQVLLEGLAQAMPLFIVPDDELLIARVRLDLYTQLVRAEIHLALNSGTLIRDCADHARARVPWWTDTQISSILTDRGTDPLLRSYLWAYPAGFDWFAALSDADASVVADVLHAAYRDPLAPEELAALWPAGPAIGGPGGSHLLPHGPVGQ
jgi:hypothetical protein